MYMANSVKFTITLDIIPPPSKWYGGGVKLTKLYSCPVLNIYEGSYYPTSRVIYIWQRHICNMAVNM